MSGEGALVIGRDGVELDAARLRERIEQLQTAWPGRWAVCRDWCRPFFVVVPVIDFDVESDSASEPAADLEAHVLAALEWLRFPSARLLIMTRSAVAPEVFERGLGWLAGRGIDLSHARARLRVEVIGEAPASGVARRRAIERVGAWLSDPKRAFVATGGAPRAAALVAATLGLPLFGATIDQLELECASSARALFQVAGVQHPFGECGVRSFDQLVGALTMLRMDRPQIAAVRVKLERGGERSMWGRICLDRLPPAGDLAEPGALTRCVRSMRFPDHAECTLESFLERLRRFGGVVEEEPAGEETRTAWVSMVCLPDRHVQLNASAELRSVETPWGSAELTRLPADPRFAGLLNDEAQKLARYLVDKGVFGPVTLRFKVTRSGDWAWRPHAVGLSLRLPAEATLCRLLADFEYDEDTAAFRPSGETHEGLSFVCAPRVGSNGCRQLEEDDLIEAWSRRGILYGAWRRSGVALYRGAELASQGRFGVLACGADLPRAMEALERSLAAAAERERSSAATA